MRCINVLVHAVAMSLLASGAVAVLPPNTTTFTRTGLPSRTWMCFTVEAFDAAGSSAWIPHARTYTL